MGAIHQSPQSIDLSKTPVLKETKNDLIDKLNRKKALNKQIIKRPDINQIIFQTIFPPPFISKQSNPISLPHINNSFDYSSLKTPTLEYNNDDGNNDNEDIMRTIPKCSHCSMNDDNSSVQSDLIDIRDMPLKCLKDLKEKERLLNKSNKLRQSYYAQLVMKKVWRPTQQIRNHNTLFFFDWDDTLMCTSFITPSGQFTDEIKISDKDKEKIHNLDSTVSAIIQKTTSLGDVYIVTNAAPGWVEYSSNKFYPETFSHLSKANIISARGSYEKKYPGNTKQWKVMAFLEVLNILNTKLITNLICFGDSIIEIEAAHTLGSKFPHVYIKTVKFKENPMPVELQKQLNLIVNQLDKIYSSVKNLTIRVEKKKNE